MSASTLTVGSLKNGSICAELATRDPQSAIEVDAATCLGYVAREIEMAARVSRVTREGDAFSIGLEFDEPSPSLARSIAAHEQEDEIARLRTLVEASKLINSSIEPDALFDSILSVARKELHVERGTLYFVDEKKGEIWAKIGSHLEGREIRLAIGRGIAGSVAATGEMIVMHDAYADDRFDSTWDRASGYRTRSMLCVPIRNRQEKIVGVL